ncbi:MAG: hypothetical protein WBL61_24690 [Bryobacteraceae bacterium]
MSEQSAQARWVAGMAAALAILLTGCPTGGGPVGGGGNQTLDFTLTLSASTVLAPQDGTPAPVNAAIARPDGNTNSVTLTAAGLPAGIEAQFVQPGSGSAGTATLVASGATPAGTYTVKIQASDGGPTTSQPLTVVVGIVAAVGSTVDSESGVGGKLQQALGVVFEPDSWRNYFLPLDWDALEAMGTEVMSVHTVDYIPMQANTGQASDWNFTNLDANLLPALAVGNRSPQFVIVQAPPFLNIPSNDGSGVQFVFNNANLQTFAQYCANLVRYYNAGGFDWGGQHFQAPAGTHIAWWQIFNEYNINGLLPTQYVQLYNTIVPAMKAVDPTIKVSALALANFDYLTTDLRNNLPWFVASPANGGVSAEVDAATLHLYSSTHQTDTDTQVFSTIPTYTNDIGYFYQELRSRPDLSNVPVWVTESGVQADYQVGGISITTGKPFVLDVRGSDAFDAAWQPYLFSKIGKAGCQRLLHWSFSDDAQFGLINEGNNYKYLSYWVEHALLQKFPWDGVTPGPDILDLNATETSTVEILATRNSDGSVVVMMADHAVHAPNDNNGPGDPRTVIVDVTALGTFTTATQLTIDTNTDLVNGPAEVAITPAPRMTVSLGGYGVTFLTLHP